MADSIHFVVLRQHLAGGKANSRVDVGDIHKTMMLFSWLLLAGVGLWAHRFKHKRWAIPLHAFCMGLLTLLTVLAGFLAIIQFGLNSMSRLHVGLGLTIIALVIIVATGGVSCHTLELQVGVKPIYVYVINRIHRFAGRILIVIVMIQLLTTLIGHIALFIFVILLSVVPFIIFYILKFRELKINNMDNISMSQLQNYEPANQKLPVIRSVKDLAIFKDNYFIFANKVYPIQNIINSHPGGWEIINAIRGRQVDRYWYGMEILEVFTKRQMVAKDHSQMAIKMAGDPIAMLYNHSPYPNMNQISICVIQQLLKPCNNDKMYAVYLASKNGDFKYIGYSQLEQLGKYFSVNINNNLTRLYCVVNFLHRSNLQLMDKIIRKPTAQNNKLLYGNNYLKEVQSSNPISSNLLPLFMKRYENGKFTKQFTSEDFKNEIKISKPRGRGLCLHQLGPGSTILIFAGGTGLNVYCDLIDLLFKSILIGQNSQFTNQIIAKNPILRQHSVDLFYYIIFIAVEQITQIHPLTLYQLNYLAERTKLKVFVKSKDQGRNSIYQQNKGIIMQTRNFETVIDQYFSDSQNIARIYLCGPPPFSHAIVSELSRLQIDPTKYKVM